MPIEFKDVAQYLGIDSEKIENFDQFKESFDKEFVRSSAIDESNPFVKSIVGKKVGSLETDLKRLSSQFGADWNSDEFKDKTISERMKMTADKIVSDHNSIFEEYKKTNGGDKEEVIKEWSKKYEKLKAEKSDLEGLLNTTKSGFETFKSEVENEKKNYKISIEKEGALKDFKWKTGTNDFTKKGFMSELEGKFKLDLSTEGKLIVTDREGKQIPNPKVAGTFMSWNEVVESEAKKAELYEVNPHSGQPTGTRVQMPTPQPNQPIARPQQNGAYIHPSALR